METSAAHGAVLALTGLFVCSNAAAILLGKPNPERTGRAVKWLQRSTTAQLALAGWVYWLGMTRGTGLSDFSLLIAAGLTLSFLADLIMAEYIRVGNRVIGGILVFGAAHIAYITAYSSVSVALQLDRPFWPALGVWMPVGILLWAAAVRSPAQPRVLNYGALGYTLLLATMVAGATSLAVADRRFWFLGLGTVLFLASDLMLGNHIFRKNKWPYVSDVAWLTYVAGQCAIVWSNDAAFSMLRSLTAGSAP